MNEVGGTERAGATAVPAELDERAHHALVVDFNRSTAAYPARKTVIDLFREQAERTPEAEAIHQGTRRLTYSELAARTGLIAAHLQSLGVKPGQIVVVLMERSIDAVAALLGVLAAGAAYVPLDSGTPALRVASILHDVTGGQDGTVPIVITHSQLAGRLPQGHPRIMVLDQDWSAPAAPVRSLASPESLAYVIYTSGSTGVPKGVMIEHRSLTNYVWWAREQYSPNTALTWPLFTSLAFDLTVSSVFTPLVSGGRIVVYGEEAGSSADAILRVVDEGIADVVKLTPTHLAMIKDMNLGATNVRTFIVGGEDFKTALARDITRRMGRPVDIYNEYGPTEATVGCMIHRYDANADRAASVPIGSPAANAQVYILDQHMVPVPMGVIGELCLGGVGLARGYLNRPDLTAQAFVHADDPRRAVGGTDRERRARLYKTGDLARWSAAGHIEFLGRADDQVKIGGFRIELGDIETALLEHPHVRACVAAVADRAGRQPDRSLTYCARCGLASNFPGTTYDAAGVCNICRAYDAYAEKAEAYFKTKEELRAIIRQMQAARTGDYDCIVLFSGGKDSTYMLYQLCDLGVKPLVFFLDNGFISEEAKTNIKRVVDALGVDLVFGTTPHMNEIFVDSLNQFSNVCNGCFKTIYTLAVNLAKARGISYIVTGLSRGQFFETRLTEEVFQRSDFDSQKIDALVLEARKAYHQRDDAVSCHLAVDVLRGDGVLDDIQFVDFYRYWSVPLEELYAYLRGRNAWIRPSDTGRSTNCLINDVGIYLHKKQRGFHNYALPYSWDVRLGQKTREEAMAELDDEIDETRVKDIMTTIGYSEAPAAGAARLIAYYVSDRDIPAPELRAHLASRVPEYMVPAIFVRLDALPLTPHGKVDRRALPRPGPEDVPPAAGGFVGPRNEIERTLAGIWTDLLQVEAIGINDGFFELGGHSLLAIRAVSRIRDAFGVEIPFSVMFRKPTIAGLAEAIGAAQGPKA